MNNGEFIPLARPRLNLRRFIFYFVTLAALILIYLKYSELKMIKDVFTRSNALWLVAIIVSQFFNYISLALNYRDVLKIKDLKISVWKLFPVTFVVQFLNQALPSATLSGQAFFVQYLKKYGLTLAEGIGRAVLELLTLCVAFGVFFIASIILMFRSNLPATLPQAIWVVYFFIFISIVFLLIFFTLQKNKRGKLASWAVNRIHRYFENSNKTDHSGHIAMFLDKFRENLSIGELSRRKKILFWAIFWQGAVLLFNIISLYLIALAIGANITFEAAFISFTLVRFVSMVSFVPGAFGVFEGGMTLVLVSLGVAGHEAFAVTLLFRAFTFWFPMPIGWALYRFYLHRQEQENPALS